MGPGLARRHDPTAGSAARRPAPHAPAPDVRATLLALQRTAGNRAVAAMIQRSATDEDAARQRDDDVDSVQYLLNAGETSLVQAVEPDPGETGTGPIELSTEPVTEEPATSVASTADVPEFDAPSWWSSPPVDVPTTTFSFTPLPTPQTPFWFSTTPTSGSEGGQKRRRNDDVDERARKRGRWESPTPTPQPAPTLPFVFQPFASHPLGVPMQFDILATWPSNRRRLQRKNPIVGTFAPPAKQSGSAFTWRKPPKAGSATKTRTNYTAKAHLTSNATTLKTGIHTHGDLTPGQKGRRGTATEMKVKRWGHAKGTGTATKVRPVGWDRFQALCGFIDKGHKCVWVQGHFLYEHLGGRGNRMENLAPFTTSLNKRHQNQVEVPLWQWLEDEPKGEERTIDYQVVPSYGGGGSPTVIDRALGYFRDFVDDRNDDALDTLVRLGILDKKDVATVQGLDRTDKTALTAPTRKRYKTWKALCDGLEREITHYVKSAFPTRIDCYARLYQRVKKKQAVDWEKTRTQHHTLDNYQ